jgi:hypothetical protein
MPWAEEETAVMVKVGIKAKAARQYDRCRRTLQSQPAFGHMGLSARKRRPHQRLPLPIKKQPADCFFE